MPLATFPDVCKTKGRTLRPLRRSKALELWLDSPPESALCDSLDEGLFEHSREDFRLQTNLEESRSLRSSFKQMT